MVEGVLSNLQPAGAIQIIATGDLRDAVLSHDGTTVYASNGEGWVTQFNVATGDIINRWQVGGRLGGMDLSPDGRYLVATEQDFTALSPYPNYSMSVTVHHLDLATGNIRNFTSVSSGTSTGIFYDAEYMSNGKILLTYDVYSGWTPLVTLDPATGVFTATSETYSSDGVLSSTADGTKIILAPQSISDMPIYVYTPGVGVTAKHGNYADGVSGFNRGVQAISSDGNLIAQDTHIYDGSLNYKINIYNVNRSIYNPSGLVFSGDSKHLYVLNASESKVFQLSTVDWSIEKVFSLGFKVLDGTSSSLSGAYGDRLSLTADGQYLMVLGQKTLAAMNLQTVVADGGTDKNDQFVGGATDESLAGYAGNDLIDGGAGGDSLSGGAGDDTLIGGLGNDSIDGGLGVDTVSYASAAAGVVVELGATYGQTASGVGFDSLYSIENATGSAFADRLLGSSVANVLGGGDGADTLWGGGGGDTLLGGAGSDVLQGQDGDDVLDGGEGIDLASYENAAAAVIVDLSTSTLQNTRGDGLDLLRNIEGLIGTRFGDKLTGSSADDILRGGEGVDTLIGGLGADVLSGDAGDDVLDGGAGGDVASYATAGIGVTVDLGLVGAQDTRGAGLDALLSIEGLIGSRFGDTLKGGIGGDTIVSGEGPDFVDGGQGDDLIRGEGGANILWGGEGSDSIEGGADFDQINGNVGNDTARGGEGGDWVVGGKDQDLLYGENGADVVYGNLGNDTCYGGEGADWVRGGQGDDVIDGGAGNDWMAGDRGDDTVTGGAGADIFYFFAGAAIDRVTDFSSAAGDRVLLDAGQAYTLSYTAEGAVISLGVGDQMILFGVTEATLGAWLFV